ncbi:MAG TPA: hypothetical protein VGR26_09860 [Acidimicrobiales bacterium]|nr:hypothetical protein [Acidimicrobiales bacterium]
MSTNTSPSAGAKTEKATGWAMTRARASELRPQVVGVHSGTRGNAGEQTQVVAAEVLEPAAVAGGDRHRLPGAATRGASRLLTDVAG